MASTPNAALASPVWLEMPSPNGEPRPNGATISVIVIHDTQEDNEKLVLGLFTSRSFRKTPHYTITKSGAIFKHLDDYQMGAHAGKSCFLGRTKVNQFSIGIELVNKGDGKDCFPYDQYLSLAKLVYYLMGKHNIAFSHVVGHRDVAIPAGRKTDPASNFSFSKLRRLVEIEAARH